MAAFNYTGNARIVWKDKPATVQFIDYAADTGTLAVWPDGEAPEAEFIGQMRDHPAVQIVFLH